MNRQHNTFICASGADCPDCRDMVTAECHVPCSPPPRHGYFFAPGTVETCTPTRTDTFARGLLAAAALAALAAAIGISAGWITVGSLL